MSAGEVVIAALLVAALAVPIVAAWLDRPDF